MLKKLFYSFKLIFKLHPLCLFLIFLFSALSAFFSAYLLLFIKDLSAKLMTSPNINTFITQNTENLTIAGICFLAAALFAKVQSVYCEKSALKINQKINSSIFQKAEHLYGLQHFDNPNYFVMADKLYFGDFVIENYLISISPLAALIINTIFISLLFNFITPVLFATLIFANIPSFFIRKKIAAIREKEIEQGNQTSYKLSYYTKKSIDVGAAKDLRLFAFTGLFLQKIENSFSVLKDLRIKTISKTLIWNSLDLIVKSVFTIGIFVLFFKSIINPEITAGTIMMTVIILFQLSSNISGIGSFWSYLQKELDYFFFYNEFLNLKSIENGSIELEEQIKSIQFKNVSFAYGDRLILDNISFTLAEDKVFALVGKNGAGKSTIVKLILRFIEPSKGEILINGIDIKEYKIESYRKNISVIFQNFMRYGLSAKENVFANKDTTKYNHIDNILSSDLFSKMPQKENTQLNMGFGGHDISGGEWQRIAVMRGLAKPYSFFIADEPTANIDPIEEYNIFKQIINKTKGMRLIITHRMGSIKDCDKIFVLRNGTIESNGDHLTLMQTSEYYASLYNSQKSMYTKTKGAV